MTLVSPTPELIQQLSRDNDTFKQRCLDFYVTAAQEVQKRFPFRDELLKKMSFLDPSQMLSTSARSGPSGIGGLRVLVSHFKEKLGLDSRTIAHEWRRLPAEITGSLRDELTTFPVDDMRALIKQMRNERGEAVFGLSDGHAALQRRHRAYLFDRDRRAVRQMEPHGGRVSECRKCGALSFKK